MKVIQMTIHLPTKDSTGCSQTHVEADVVVIGDKGDESPIKEAVDTNSEDILAQTKDTEDKTPVNIEEQQLAKVSGTGVNTENAKV